MANKEKTPKPPAAPGYEPNWQNLSKLALYVLALWAFCSGVYGVLLTITVEIREGIYRHLPPKYLGDWTYDGIATRLKPAADNLPKLMPWIKAACGSNTGDVTCVASSTDNAIGFAVDSACGTVCLNP